METEHFKKIPRSRKLESFPPKNRSLPLNKERGEQSSQKPSILKNEALFARVPHYLRDHKISIGLMPRQKKIDLHISIEEDRFTHFDRGRSIHTLEPFEENC